MSEPTKRIDTFDIAKGIVILLVILGHMMRMTLIPSLWIFSFHMPFFFIISGLFFHPQKYNSYIEYLTQKTRTLLIPSILLTLLLCAITESLSLGYNIPRCLLLGKRFPIVWFLYTLFFTEIIYYFISKVVLSYRYIILLGAIVIGYILHQHKIEFYYHAENLLTAVFFYGIGHSTLSIKHNKNNFYYENPTYKKDFLAVLGLAYPLLPVYFYRESFELSTNILPVHLIPFVLAAFSASISIIYLSSRIKYRKILSYIGQNTLIILVLHAPLIALCSNIIKPYISILPLYKIIEFSIALSGSIVFAPVINTYLPWLVGKQKIKKVSQ